MEKETKPILTIGITSYKRIKELERCIKSINTKYITDIEIIVSEDHSPLSGQIKEKVEEIKKSCPYNLEFTTNAVNLGYDMNLGSIIKNSSGKYVLLLSDDDAIYEDCLDEIIPFLKCDAHEYGIIYASYIHEKMGKKGRNHGKNFAIAKGEASAANYIYDSILFSGLIFRRDFVKDIDSARFKNINYIQVYMFLKMLYEHGGYYFKIPSVLCIEDGENAYGIAESSGGNKILADRESVKSNLEFNKTLIKVIKMFDDDMGTNVFDSFEKQYSFHSYSGLSIARKEGKQYFKEYWGILNSLDIKLYFIAKVYHVILYCFGSDFSNLIFSIPRKIVKKEN